MKQRIIGFTTLELTKKNTLVFILVFSTVIVFDSTIVKFSSYSGVNFPNLTNTGIFIIFSIIFAAGSMLLINSVRNMMSRYAYDVRLYALAYFDRIIIGTQIFTFATILIITFQMLMMNKYSIVLLKAEVYLSHISALIFLSSLVFLFASWMIKSGRNRVIILYVLSFALASVNLIVSLLYLQSYFSIASLPDVRSYSITAYVTNQPGEPFTESLSTVFDALSLSSFLLMWIATVIILSHYRHKMGNIKYYTLMVIPLIYYIFPLQGYFGDVFFTLLQSSPVSYSVLYILIFSATKQVGAVLFSLVFWTASSLVHDDRIRKSLLISSIGTAILFSSIEIAPLQYAVFPPYGLVTKAFIPLGAYLLFVGIFTSAKYVSSDAKLRKAFYRSAVSQLSILRAIGVSEMEKEFEKKVKFLEKRSKLSGISDDSPLEVEMSEDDIKETLRDVLNELYSKNTKKERSKSS